MNPTKECRDCRTVREGRGLEPKPSRFRAIVEDSGGRCQTHWHLERKRRSSNNHERRVIDVYGLGPGDYDRLYDLQGGRCALCRRSTGKARRLAVDHDHDTGLTFGLLCAPCNKDVLGWSRRDPEYFLRCIRYLENPPARQLGIVAIHKENR